MPLQIQVMQAVTATWDTELRLLALGYLGDKVRLCPVRIP